ncbi:MAG: DUF4058 family protein [Chloroflexota bacterium]
MAENPFPGVNPYLNSVLLQPGGGWEMFHAEHIAMIRRKLDVIMPENYYSASEKSMQIGLPDASLPAMRTQPDVSVFRKDEISTVAPSTTEAIEPVLAMPLALPTDEFDLMSVNIYQTEGGSYPGVLVTRIELLSPANVPGGSHHDQYMSKRYETLMHGVNVVELHYLHTMHPVLSRIPSYRRRDEGAYPYYIIVGDQRPLINEMRVFGAAIDQPLPEFTVPLAKTEGVLMDLQDVYDTTFAGARVFSVIVDYDKPLLDADAYTEADQKRIAEIIKKEEQ